MKLCIIEEHHYGQLHWFYRLSITCKMRGYFYQGSESFTQWILVAFCLERIIALFWPLRAKSIITPKFPKIAIFVVFIWCSLVAIPAIFSYDVRISQIYKDGYNCQAIGAEGFISLIMVFLTTGQKYPYSTSIIFVLTLIIALKILSLSKSRKKLFGEGSSKQSSIGGKEINATISLLLMSLVQCSIYIGDSFCWETIYLNNYFQFLGKDTAKIIEMFGNLFDITTILVRLWNLYVYLIKIPIFRKEFIRLICCYSIKVKDSDTTQG